MSDLISRQDAIDIALTFFVEFLGGAFHEDDQRKLIALYEQLPSVQPEIIRCKDCKHKVLTENGEYWPEDIVCDFWESDGLTAGDFCSYAEMREST